MLSMNCFLTHSYLLNEADTFPSRGPNVDSEEGQKLQKKMWSEMLDVFYQVAPEIKDIISRQ